MRTFSATCLPACVCASCGVAKVLVDACPDMSERAHNPEEIQRVVNHLECEPDFVPELLELKARPKDGDAGASGTSSRPRDPLYDQAVEVIVREGRGSVSLLQRALGIGYGKAARFIDYMAEDGVVGGYNGAQAREVLLTMEQWEEMRA